LEEETKLRQHGEDWFHKIKNEISALPLQIRKDLLKKLDKILEQPHMKTATFTRYPLSELPPSLFKLRDLESLELYSSQVTSIPPEIGNLAQLNQFTPYTSYHLHFLPLEIMKCTKLTSSTISLRALYDNKNGLSFPDLKSFTPHRLTAQENEQVSSYNYIHAKSRGTYQYPLFNRCGFPSLKELCARTLRNDIHASGRDKVDNKMSLDIKDYMDTAKECSVCCRHYFEFYIRCWTKGIIVHDTVPLLAHACSMECVAKLIDVEKNVVRIQKPFQETEIN